MFCINCGNKIDESDKFCAFCGALVENVEQEQQSQANQQPQYNQQPQVNQQPQTNQQQQQPQQSQQPTNQPNQTNQPKELNQNKTNLLNNRKRLAIMITSIVLTIALAITGTVWYFTRNTPAAFTVFNSKSEVIPKAKAGDNADEVVKSLENKGFRTKVIDEFGGEKKGNFLRYENVKSGSKVSTKIVVKILRSKGPGVPAKGVVGASLDNAKKIVKSMGVPVKLHHVPSTDAADGKIVASSPMPGNAVGKDGVINIAVGEKCDGVPVDVFGLDKDKAKDMLSSKPFSVDLRPKFSSAKYFGKIVGAYPALGTKGSPKAVTLYYGVDASKTKDVVTEPMDYNGKTAYVVDRAGSFVGKWCTKDNKCIKLVPEDILGESNRIGGVMTSEVAKNTPPNTLYNINALYLSSWGPDPSDYAVFDKNLPNTSIMRNHLISGDTGTVELYAGRESLRCDGHAIYNFGDPSLCVNGKYLGAADMADNKIDREAALEDPGINVGLYYVMQDFMVVVPVGAKFDKLVNSGYFAGKVENKPDLTRPFILRRNPKLYKETRKNLAPGEVNWIDPFVPTERSRAVPFAPAPDDSNAYYLVEEPFDWSAIPGESL